MGVNVTVGVNLTVLAAELPLDLLSNASNCSLPDDEERIQETLRLVHGLVIPVLSIVGMILNVLNLIVLSNGKLKESSYTYLTGLAFADLWLLLLFFLNGIGRGYYPHDPGWRYFEAFVYFPCGFMASTAGALLTVTVSAERYVFIYRPMKAKELCTKRVARRVMAVMWAVCIALNIPRFFVFKVNESAGKLVYTDFGKGDPYKYLSWFQFLFVSCSCGLALIILNILLIRGIRQNNHRRQVLGSKVTSHQKQDELRLTRTLISIVFIFLMGEIPSALTSRGLVVGLSGKPCIVETRGFKISSLIATVLIVLQLSLNFVVYCVCNLRFWAIFKQQMCGCEEQRRRHLRVNHVNENNNAAGELTTFHPEPTTCLNGGMTPMLLVKNQH